MMTGDAGSDESPGEVPEAVRERIEADRYCATLGIEVVDLDPGRAVTRLTVTEDLLNFHGTPHGGAVYSLADAAFAAASNARGETAVALETNISFLPSRGRDGHDANGDRGGDTQHGPDRRVRGPCDRRGRRADRDVPRPGLPALNRRHRWS